MSQCGMSHAVGAFTGLLIASNVFGFVLVNEMGNQMRNREGVFSSRCGFRWIEVGVQSKVLFSYQFSVQTILQHQFAMSSLLNHFALIEHDDVVRIANGGQPMSSDDNRTIFAK